MKLFNQRLYIGTCLVEREINGYGYRETICRKENGVTHDLCVAFPATGCESHLAFLQGPVSKSNVSHLQNQTNKNIIRFHPIDIRLSTLLAFL